MTENNKQSQNEGSEMASLPCDDYAQNTMHQNGAKGDELGPNTEIGSKLRALYSSIQDETIPDRFLDLLEKLDQVERKSASDSRN